MFLGRLHKILWQHNNKGYNNYLLYAFCNYNIDFLNVTAYQIFSRPPPSPFDKCFDTCNPCRLRSAMFHGFGNQACQPHSAGTLVNVNRAYIRV
jgi:hypothetical protein